MDRKAKISGGIAALALLAIISAQHIGQEPTPPPQTRPVSPVTQADKGLTPPKPKTAPVGEEPTNVEPHSTPPTEIDFEPPQPNGSQAIQTPKEPPGDNPTPTPTPSQITATVPVSEPKMGDTRTVDGQKQVYFLGFGWIEDNDTPNECSCVDDMYVSGNKVGTMGGGTFVDCEGDINKMVGIMD